MDPARTVLVTGASRGLGLETCRQLAERGLAVIATSRGEGGEATVRGLASRAGRSSTSPTRAASPRSPIG